jgi:hypothetical protein
MVRLTLRFYAELNGFLAPSLRGAPVTADVSPTATIKDVIESRGVPHTEVDLILASGEPVDFAYRGRDGERIAAYPPFARHLPRRGASSWTSTWGPWPRSCVFWASTPSTGTTTTIPRWPPPRATRGGSCSRVTGACSCAVR